MSIAKNISLTIDIPFEETLLQKGVFLAIVHASRIPPHIGLIIGGSYYSLTVKGQDIDIPVGALIKNTVQRKIPTLFVKLKQHSTFSEAYLKEHFIADVKQFPRVDVGVATCLSPIKLFFSDVYRLPIQEVNFLYELLPVLLQDGLVEGTSGLFIEEKHFQLPLYSQAEIDKGILGVRNLVAGLPKK